ncbi:MAG: 3-isopropylmalate dehydratase, partial [Caenispirillum sp.]|nr:3-isopropylmalate dehydratase [Caenispirillum sp.]
MPQTLFDKIWEAHVVERRDGVDLLHIDRHVLHELTTHQAFQRLAATGRPVRNPELTFAVPDHMVSSDPGRTEDTYAPAGPYVRTLRRNASDHGITLFDIDDPRQGIVHVVAPELGIALPGTTLVCGDSHTCTVGGLGALAFGIGTSDVEHVLATQTLALRKPKTLRVVLDGPLGPGVTAKDLILHVIATLGAGAGVGHAVEFAGPAVRALPVEGRLTLCNMAIEFSARFGLVAPDEATFRWIEGRPFAPAGRAFEQAVTAWHALPTDPAAAFDREERLNVAGLAPQVTWGTSPQFAVGVDGRVPDA